MNDIRRERDERGRPRNARPRDGLGRPLPHGATGVPRAGEGKVRLPSDTLVEAQRMLDSGMPFHAHEVLEDAWKSAPPAERDLWRSLAQLAVGLTHLYRGNPTGARALLVRGSDGIRPFMVDPPYGIDVRGLVAWAADALESLDGPPDAGRMRSPRLCGDGVCGRVESSALPHSGP